ncbi:amino acid adenylation domain-containing protein [Nocardia lasii]|uniref:Amino acid adenylation domain-containing protein n=1 Tax=Nocardia lasii TaxID=1616107 RepID=A0ABW1JQQ6_9NOCA
MNAVVGMGAGGVVGANGADSTDGAMLGELFGRFDGVDAIAVVEGGRAMTYRELGEVVARWARVLLACGVGPGSSVVSAVPRSLESVVAVRAVAAAGGCFVPVDVADPGERVGRIVAGVGAVVGLTTRAAVLSGVGVGKGISWLVLDDLAMVARAAAESSAPVTDADRAGRLMPAHPAYLIHTSGTTGAPKGVVVTHSGLGALTRHLLDRYATTPDSTVLHAHSPAFDAHLLELLAAFAAGARLVIEPPEVVAGAELTALLAEHRVTHLLTTPAVLATLRPDAVPTLTTVVVGGESCPPELVCTWASRVNLHNGYGPTEATVMATQSAPLRAGEPVTIGCPLPEVVTCLLDSRLRPVLEGARAELYLGGPCLAQGYRDDPATTATHFIADPTGTGTRLYRTGDLVGPRPDGGYEFLGRIDTQLSLRGRRIEPAEIEAALLTDPTIAQAAVHITTPNTPTARLIAYIVPTPTASADEFGIPGSEALPVTELIGAVPGSIAPTDEFGTPFPERSPAAESIRVVPTVHATAMTGESETPGSGAAESDSATTESDADSASAVPDMAAAFDSAAAMARLRTILPAALVPATLITLDELPLTANGKLDRAALPAPDITPYRAPRTPLEHLIAATFAAACELDLVGIDDDFFAIGGNSLTGVGVSAELAEATNIPITVRWLYTAPTVATMAHRIQTHCADTDPGADALATVLPLRTTGTRPPLFCVHSAVPLAWCYTGLAQHITDRPVYGLQAPTLTSHSDERTAATCSTSRSDPAHAGESPSGTARNLTVDFLADTYATEINRLHPTGPVHLLGWSLGGQLAHATAIRLRAEGRDVTTLAMLDSVVLPDHADPPPRPRMRDLLTHLLGDEPGDADALPDLSADEAATELAAAGPTLGQGLTPEQLTDLHAAYADGVRLSHGYRPDLFDGDLLYFCATEGQTAFLDASMWRPYVTGHLTEHRVHTTHAQLTNPDVVARIGPILDHHLRTVETVAVPR